MRFFAALARRPVFGGPDLLYVLSSDLAKCLNRLTLSLGDTPPQGPPQCVSKVVGRLGRCGFLRRIADSLLDELEVPPPVSPHRTPGYAFRLSRSGERRVGAACAS